MDTKSLQQTADILAKNWGLSTPSAPGMEGLKASLRLRILELLEDNFGGLVNAMYRIDVAESAFKAALNAGSTDAVADQVTDLVLQRELQRLETRRQYRNSES